MRGKAVDDRGEPVEAEVTVIGLESLGPRVRGSENGRFRVGLKAADVVRVGVAADGFRSLTAVFSHFIQNCGVAGPTGRPKMSVRCASSYPHSGRRARASRR